MLEPEHQGARKKPGSSHALHFYCCDSNHWCCLFKLSVYIFCVQAQCWWKSSGNVLKRGGIFPADPVQQPEQTSPHAPAGSSSQGNGARHFFACRRATELFSRAGSPHCQTRTSCPAAFWPSHLPRWQPLLTEAKPSWLFLQAWPAPASPRYSPSHISTLKTEALLKRCCLMSARSGSPTLFWQPTGEHITTA